jgi:anaerobic selenocysteine-containing dehydrogenase
VKKVSIASRSTGVFDLAIPTTAWTERVGTYTALFGADANNAKLTLRMGSVPPTGARSLRWIFAEALRRLGTEISAAETAGA